MVTSLGRMFPGGGTSTARSSGGATGLPESQGAGWKGVNNWYEDTYAVSTIRHAAAFGIGMCPDGHVRERKMCPSGHGLRRSVLVGSLDAQASHDLEEAGVVGQVELLCGAGDVPVVPLEGRDDDPTLGLGLSLLEAEGADVLA